MDCDRLNPDRRVVRLGSPGRYSSSDFISRGASCSKRLNASMGKVLHLHPIMEILHEYVFGHSNDACVLVEGKERNSFSHCCRHPDIPLCGYLHAAELVCDYFLHGSSAQGHDLWRDRSVAPSD